MSLSLRLAAAFVGLVAAVAVVFAAVGFASARSGISGQLDEFLRERAEELVAGDRSRPDVAAEDIITTNTGTGDDELTVGETSDDGDQNDGKNNDRKDRKSNSFDADSVVQTIDSDGDPIASTGLTLPIDGTDIALAASGTDNTLFRSIVVDGKQLRMITAAIPDGGAVQVAREQTESNSTIDIIQGQLAIAIPIVALLAAGAGLLLARRITKPLRSLAATVDNVAATGNLAVPIEVSGDDEVGRLASGFDNLLQSLSESRQQQHQLVQDAAHELRTPLTSVKANIDLLSAAPNLDQDARTDTIRSVQSELRELTKLVDEIVDVATDRFSPQDFTTIDLGAAANEAIERFRARHPDRPLEVDVAGVPVRGDHDSLVRAIGNLLSNADKYSPQGPPVAISVTTDRTVVVTDHGPGFAPADRERAFDRFYRSDEARAMPGSGLGLAIVASVVDAHRGSVAIDENPGGGAVVSFQLPG
jgi:two-component system sensor histidine kinase MprB